MLVGETSNLCQVGHANHLMMASQSAQFFAYLQGRFATHTRIHFVKNQSLFRGTIKSGNQGQEHPGKFPSGSDLDQGT